MPVSPRQNRKAATVDNVSAVVWPHKRPRDREAEAKQEKQASDQFLAALRTRLCRYHTKFERGHYDGLTASKVAEDSERLNKLHKLTSLVWARSRRSNLDMSRFSVHEDGRRPEVTDPRFPTFLEVGHSDVRHGSPTARSEHFTNYLKARLSEPYNRGILQSTHHVGGFLEQITGAPTTGRLTASQPRLSSRSFSCRLPGRAQKQPPRMLL